MAERNRVFIDMDGTLAEFRTLRTLETLYEEGYFLNLKPIPSMVTAARLLKVQLAQLDVYILSAYLKDSKYAYQEKNQWLSRYLSEFDNAHRLFVPVGEGKDKYVPLGIKKTDLLLDDYTKNLVPWSCSGKGVKILNGINHNNGIWRGNCISAAQHPQLIVNKVARIIKGETIIDEKPQNRGINHVIKLYRDDEPTL